MQTKNEATKKAHEIKNAAIAFGVYGAGSKRLGDVALTSKGIAWNKGSAKSAKDVTVKWDAFIDWMQSQLNTSAKAPKKAAKPRAKAAANGSKVATKAAPAKKAPAAKKASAPKAARKTKSAAKKVH